MKSCGVTSSLMKIFLEKVDRGAFGIPAKQAIKQKICVVCKDDITGFRDDLSAKEYQLSGLCQGCQDEVFAE
jgi:hypothetical protein